MQNVGCKKHAPHIFFVKDAIAYIVHGCCNSWTCPRCGIIRAKQEYRKIIFGAEKLNADGYDLYFITLTCRGKELSLKDAESNYYKWTTTLLNACRTKSGRAGEYWAYCQVTERQRRGHPHSHVITTYLPHDAKISHKTTNSGERREVLLSDWFLARCKSADLGPQYEITKIRSAKAVASYVAKYLFKEAISTEWPKGWRRIRYSRKWPREKKEALDDGWPLLNKGDWKRVKDRQTLVRIDDFDVFLSAKDNNLNHIKWTGG